MAKELEAIYFDTNALAKLYHVEVGIDVVESPPMKA